MKRLWVLWKHSPHHKEEEGTWGQGTTSWYCSSTKRRKYRGYRSKGGLQSKRLTASLLIKRKKFIRKRVQFVVSIHESEHIKGLYMVSRRGYGTVWKEALESERRGPENKEAYFTPRKQTWHTSRGGRRSVVIPSSLLNFKCVNATKLDHAAHDMFGQFQ
eukprot:1153298-Pelagomonas_calceolata.AAC.3